MAGVAVSDGVDSASDGFGDVDVGAAVGEVLFDACELVWCEWCWLGLVDAETGSCVGDGSGCDVELVGDFGGGVAVLCELSYLGALFVVEGFASHWMSAQAARRMILDVWTWEMLWWLAMD